MTNRLKMREMLLVERNIGEGEECPTCQGHGKRLYGSTSTWRGGIGGQAFTTDVCDSCWGSGLKDCPWPSHREFYEMKRRLDDV